MKTKGTALDHALSPKQNLEPTRQPGMLVHPDVVFESKGSQRRVFTLAADELRQLYCARRRPTKVKLQYNPCTSATRAKLYINDASIGKCRPHGLSAGIAQASWGARRSMRQRGTCRPHITKRIPIAHRRGNAAKATRRGKSVAGMCAEA